jgi:hypothetical protein
MADEPYSAVFHAILSHALYLEVTSSKFMTLLERLYLALVSGHLSNQKISFEEA